MTRLILSVLFLLIVSSPVTGIGAATKPVQRVLIVDAPVSYTHTFLRDHIDHEVMQGIVTETEATLADINDSFLGRLRKVAGQAYLSLLAGEEAAIASNGKGEFSVQPETPEVASALALLSHGTAMASLVASGLRETKIINFPLNPGTGLTVSSIPTETLDDIIKSLNVRVVNLSLRTGEDVAVESTATEAKPTSPEAMSKIWRDARDSVKNSYERLKKLVEENPETVFVLAAGNSPKNVAEDEYSYAKIRAPNLVKVAALTGANDLHDYSAYSEYFVDVAVVVHELTAAGITDKTTVTTSGTSSAAALVSNKITRIFDEAPISISSAEAVKRFYDGLHFNPALVGKVRGGRQYITDNELNMDPLIKPGIIHRIQRGKVQLKGEMEDYLRRAVEHKVGRVGVQLSDGDFAFAFVYGHLSPKGMVHVRVLHTPDLVTYDRGRAMSECASIMTEVGMKIGSE